MVDPASAEVLGAQWGELHGQDAAPSTDEVAPGHRRRTWGRPDRPPAIELWTLPAIGHGFPVDANLPGSGRTSPFLARADLSAARRIATFWLLNNDHAKRAALRR